MRNTDETNLFELYNRVNEIQRYEGQGIWSRFNILISLNIVLFGGVTFILSSKVINGIVFVKVLSVCGCILSLWSLYVLQRLWLWHAHWKKTLQSIEAFFPDNLPKPFTDRPPRLKKSSTWLQNWILAYTQPFLLIFFVIWLSLLILSFNNDIKINPETNNQKTTSTPKSSAKENDQKKLNETESK